MNVSVKNYYLPQSLPEALKLLNQQQEDMLVIGGGTVVMPLINEGISSPEEVMGLRQTGLDYLRQSNGTVTIGATTTLTTILRQAPIRMLAEAAGQTAAWSVRNMATVGGNFFVPPPAGDLATALLALDAHLTLTGPSGERILPASEFYTGFLSTKLEPGELLTEITVAVPDGLTAFIKYGRKQANTPSIVTVAAYVMLEGNMVTHARLALNAVGPYPFRAQRAENRLIGAQLDEQAITEAANEAAAECEPFTDAIASEWYRRKMTRVFVTRALRQIAGKESA
jgi:CO/xanthine dehydrogenase FAD-binding subunit